MSESHDALPEDRDEQNQQLITSLRRSYDTSNEDKQSLTRIRERLLQVSAGSLPHSDQMSIVPLPTQSRRKGKTDMQFIHNAFIESKTWQQRLGTIAAVILVLVLAGSMATLFYARSHQSDLGNPTLSPGWKQVASFSGTGSKTLTNVNIHLTQLWGDSLGCIGDANFRVELVEIRNSIDSGCATKAPASILVEPQSFQLGNSSLLTLNTVKITAPSNLQWYLRLANSDASAMPFLSTLTAPENQWTNVVGVGVSGGPSDIVVMNNISTTTKTWGLVTRCNGKGVLQAFLLSTNNGYSVDSPCDGKTHFATVQYPVPTKPDNIKIRITISGTGFVDVLKCQNEKACSNLQYVP